MKSVAEGESGMSPGFIDEMNFCLDCQACETACPAGVEYGKLVEDARVNIAAQKAENWLTRLFKQFALGYLFEEPRRIRILSRLLRAYQSSGIDSFFKKSGILRIISERMDQMQFLVPQISINASSKILNEYYSSVGPSRHKVGFLTGCIMDVAFPEINTDTVELLRHHGCDVYIPPGQVCCGSLSAHNGDIRTARTLARRNVEIFSALNLDAVIMNSAGCGAFMKEYGHVLANDAEWNAPARQFAGKVKDISEYLAEIGIQVDGSMHERYVSKRVTYHDACHLVHSQKISEEPRKLIQSIPFVHFVELPESTWCCGSAGVYNITHYETSMELLRRKIANVKKISPDIIISGNPGCLIQLQHGLRSEGLEIELLHLSTFLRRVCCD
jgi:glycolate oxidase iron-sulfur subunit